MNFKDDYMIDCMRLLRDSKIFKNESITDLKGSVEGSASEKSVLLSDDDLEELFELIEAGKSLGDDDFSNILKRIESIISKNKSLKALVLFL